MEGLIHGTSSRGFSMLEEAFWNLVWTVSFLSLGLASFFSYTTIFYSHIEGHIPAVKLNTYEDNVQLCTCWKLLSCIYSLQSSKGPYMLALQLYSGTVVTQWLRCYVTNRKVAGSIPDGVIGIFHWHNLSDRTMALGSTQPLTEMSTRRISWG